MRISTCLLLLLSFAPYSTSAVGKEVQDDQRLLLASCQALAAQSEPTSSNVCFYYIQGFLAGARSANTVNTAPLSEANDQWSFFTKRAYRTRVGSRSYSKQPTHINHFCLPDDESLAQVIDVLSKPLSSPAETIDVLKARFVQVLKAEYPCV